MADDENSENVCGNCGEQELIFGEFIGRKDGTITASGQFRGGIITFTRLGYFCPDCGILLEMGAYERGEIS